MNALGNFGPRLIAGQASLVCAHLHRGVSQGFLRIAYAWTRQPRRWVEKHPGPTLANAIASAANHPGARPVADSGADASARSSSGRPSRLVRAGQGASRVAG